MLKSWKSFCNMLIYLAKTEQGENMTAAWRILVIGVVWLSWVRV